MKKLLIVFALLCIPSLARAQCNGVFPNNTVCGNITGANNTPRATNPSAFLGASGGTNGQIQFNNAGALGGFTASGDATINTGTGVVSIPITTPAKGGTGVSNATNTANDILASNGTNGNFVHTALLTLINTTCTIAPNTCGALFGFINPQWYGAKCDGSTNDTTVLNTMLAAAGGLNVQFPAGTCVINAHLSVVSNTTISGQGRGISIIKQTGQDYIFGLSNVSNIYIHDLGLLGTDSFVSWASAPVGAMLISATSSQSNLTFRNLQLSAFNSTYWIQGVQTTAGSVTNVTFDNLIITTTTTDVPTDANPINNTNYAIVLFSGTGGLRWENTTVSNVQITQTGLCFGITLFSNHFKWSVINNRILNPGGANTNGHCTNGLAATNAYGILIYDLNADGNPPTDGIIAGNYILNPIASGIYFAGDGVTLTRVANSNHTLVSGNTIVGQTQSDTLLPRGGITVNLATDISVIGNFLYNNQTGISIADQNTGEISVLSNHCDSNAGSSTCLSLIAGTNGSSNTDRRIIRGNYFDALGTGVATSSVTGARFNVLDISDNTIAGGTTQISFANQFISGTATFANNTVNGAGTSSFASVTGSLYLYGNTQLVFTAATLPTAVNGSSIFVADGAPASACTGSSTGSTAFRQNNAWKCF